MMRCPRPTFAFSCALVSAGSQPQSRLKAPVFVTQMPAKRTPVPVRVNASMWIRRPFAFFTSASRSAPVVPGLQFHVVLSAPLFAIQTAANGTSRRRWDDGPRSACCQSWSASSSGQTSRSPQTNPTWPVSPRSHPRGRANVAGSRHRLRGRTQKRRNAGRGRRDRERERNSIRRPGPSLRAFASPAACPRAYVSSAACGGFDGML